MGKLIDLTAADGHKFKAYRADPAGKPKGGLVVIQEIFGVNRHMRATTDSFAAQGYVAICPALFDRVERDVELGYEPADIARGRDIRMKVPMEGMLADVQAATDAIKGIGKTGIVGYCWGGQIAWHGATKIKGIAAAVGYYGGGIVPFANLKPNCPVLLQFGDKDTGIPMSDVGAIRAATDATVEILVYPAGHGFSCDERGSFHQPSHERALKRTLAFFAEHLA